MFLEFIWDFDGTLFHTYDGMLLALTLVLRDNNVDETEDITLDRLKISLNYALDYYSKEFNLNKDTLMDSFRKYEEEYGYEKMVPFDNAQEILKYIKEIGGRNFIFTHRDIFCNNLIHKYNLSQYFTEIVTQDMGFKRKPDPDGFNHIINKYRLDREKTITIGDRELDLESGKGANIKTCLFLSKGSKFSKTADFVVKDLIDIKGI